MPWGAKWEFAARAGTTTQWSFGDTDSNIDNYAWTNRNADGMTRGAAKAERLGPA